MDDGSVETGREGASAPERGEVRVAEIAPSRSWLTGEGVCPPRPPWQDEAFRKQQEILARRRDAKRNEKYFEEVEKRRAELEAYRAERVLKVKDGEDPLIPWKVMKEKGLIDDAGYPDEEAGGAAEGGIPLPMASFGIPSALPLGASARLRGVWRLTARVWLCCARWHVALYTAEYDQGGRFDLKLPHCDVGYEAEDADVMGKVGRFFGFGKKKSDGTT
jgi:hypothetical protein